MILLLALFLALSANGMLAAQSRTPSDTTECLIEYDGFSCVTTGRDVRRAEGILASLAERRAAGSPTRAELMMQAAKQLLGTPYVAGTLDAPGVPCNAAPGVSPDREQLRIYLTKTDCILLVETCLDLASAVLACPADGKADFPSFAREVWRSRYGSRDAGEYFNRIHYTTDWIRRQEGTLLRDMTLDLGGEVYAHPIHFMSRHPGNYRQLAGADPDSQRNLQKIKQMEAELNQAPMTCIPKTRIKAIEGKIRSGDIVCFVSNVDGLDIAHVALACVTPDKVGFLHASLNEGKVVIDSQSIADYTLGRKSLAGIKIVRPL